MIIDKKDLSLCPTQHGSLFFAILLAMLLGSINYNNNAGFTLVFLLGTMVVISLFHSYQNLLGLKFFVPHVQPVFMGRFMIFPIRVKAGANQGRSLFLTPPSQVALPFSQEDKTSPWFDLKIKSRKRGYLVPKNLVLSSVYPFGLFRLSAKLSLDTKGLVYPAPEHKKIARGQAGDTRDGQKPSTFQGPDDFQGLKPYVPGNPLGRISWKTFSRGRGMFVKDFTSPTGQDILFDLSLIRQGDIESKLSLICGAILDAEKTNQRYGLKIGKTFSKMPKNGNAHLHSCLEALALYDPDQVLP
ncbi:MAG: DUF58 domain-containing protein [Desulfobacter sp.]|nr:MAG: DUF58 domain-containing protein [Desulfobacter sp.]